MWDFEFWLQLHLLALCKNGLHRTNFGLDHKQDWVSAQQAQIINYNCGDHFYARLRGAVVTKAQDPTSKENPLT